MVEMIRRTKAWPTRRTMSISTAFLSEAGTICEKAASISLRTQLNMAGSQTESKTSIIGIVISPA
jgi:hypothetical protein